MPTPNDLPVIRIAKSVVSRYLPAALVLVSYGISLLVFLWLYVQFSASEPIENFLNWNAQATGLLATILKINAYVSGNVVTSGPLALEITPECTSLPYLTILFAGIVAFPSTIFQKLWGALIGCVALSLLNLVRTSTLLFIGLWFPSALDSAHIFIWQAIMIVAAITIWVLWWRKIEKREGLQP